MTLMADGHNPEMLHGIEGENDILPVAEKSDHTRIHPAKYGAFGLNRRVDYVRCG